MGTGLLKYVSRVYWLTNGICLGGIMQELLVDFFIKDSAHTLYAETIREMPTVEWSRLQHPVKHYSSCSYNQLGQLAQLNPFALRMMLQDENLRECAADGILVTFQSEIKEKWKPSEIVIQFYALFAKMMHLAMKRCVIPSRCLLITRSRVDLFF